ncbi:alpha/beta hydrolase [Stieleria varia]|uniref:Putative hydrolase n=1 Tax=Stieleria varia TaxID=2528005 RepID=A0A5C6B2R7_9BACT|nr:lysophospholipase [Stieleria varia]TWU06117.1 putative hydrolase [Stieleria varia]
MISPEKVRFGDLDSYVVAPRSRPELAVVLCHGYGAPGHDLLGVAMEWIECLGSDASRILFVCPIAPHSLAEFGMPQGRAWWPLNMAALMDMVQAKRFDELHQKEPPGIVEAREALSSLIRAVVREVARKEIPSGEKAPLALGGFSQGAMLSMETTLRGDIPKPQLLMQFSGTVVCESQWKAAMPDHLAGVQVYQAHGTQDPILPFESAKRLRDLLKESGADARFHEFLGPHTIDSQSINDTADAIKDLLDQLEI